MSYHAVLSDSKSTTLDHDLQSEILASYDATTTVTNVQTADELLAALGDAEGIIVDAGVPVTREVITAAPSLKVVGRAGIGIDNVDLEAAAECKVTVVHHPTYALDEVATHALALLLSALRRVTVYDQRVRAGEWEWRDGQPIPRLQDVTVGFLAFGKIPRRLSTMLQGFGCSIVAHDPYVDPSVVCSHNVEAVDFETLLDRVDCLSIHVPLTEETTGMIDAAALDALDDDAVIVNTERGPVVDTDALTAALKADAIGAAGLDVSDPEPLTADHPLLEHEDVIVTPHTAWYSEGSRRQLSREIAADVGRVLVGESPVNEVTLDSPWL